MRTPARKLAALRAGWPEVARRLRAARRILLLLDFDGTLVPLRARPEQARLAPPTRALLARLARQPRISVWIVSGRSLRDLKTKVRVPRVRCLGVHGWEGLPGARLNAATRSALQEVRAALRKPIAASRGLWLEDKHISLGLHYRGAPAAEVRRARKLLRNVLRPHAGKLRLLQGKKVWEVLPRAIGGKGAAVRKLTKMFRQALPVYIGDDTTDEEAFRVVPSRGITIRVGCSRTSKAQFFANNPAEVIRFLERVESEWP